MSKSYCVSYLYSTTLTARAGFGHEAVPSKTITVLARKLHLHVKHGNIKMGMVNLN